MLVHKLRGTTPPNATARCEAFAACLGITLAWLSDITFPTLLVVSVSATILLVLSFSHEPPEVTK